MEVLASGFISCPESLRADGWRLDRGMSPGVFKILWERPAGLKFRHHLNSIYISYTYNIDFYQEKS
jgi:hypothetical protein